MNVFRGTFRLAWLVLRQERLRLPAWVIGITLLVVFGSAAIEGLFETETELKESIAVFAQNPAVRLFAMPTGGDSLGDFLSMRFYVTFAVLAALMNIFTVTRHTRSIEENGRAELIASGKIGRLSQLGAVLLVMLIANLVMAVLIMAVLTGNGLPAAGSTALALAVAGVGLVFSGVTAVAAQLMRSSRGTNGLGSAVLGGAFMASGLGSSLGEIRAGGLDLDPEWYIWLSPIGWGQLLRPFAGNDWLIAGGFVIAWIVLVSVALVIMARRDLGHGVFAVRPGPLVAAGWMRVPLGLIWRLTRSSVLGWTLGVMAMSAILGYSLDQFSGMFAELGALQELIGNGGNAFLEDFMSVLMSFMGMLIAVFGVQTALRLRQEEFNYRTAMVLSGRISRAHWLLGLTVIGAAAAIWLLLITGWTAGIMGALTTDDMDTYLVPLMSGALAQAPAVWLVFALAVLAVATVPVRGALISWMLVIAVFLTGPLLRDMLEMPDWTLYVSPFNYIADVPAVGFDGVAFIAMSLLAAIIVAIATILFRMRDLHHD